MSIIDRKNKEKDHLREKILKVAMKLFCTDGYENVSIRKIAEKIEYSPGSLYLYFKDKDEILFELHNKGFDMLYALYKDVHDTHPLDRIQKFGEIYIRFGLENPELYKLMFMTDIPIKKIIEEHCDDPNGDIYVLLSIAVQEAMDQGHLAKHDLFSATFALWGMVHGLVSLAIQRKDMVEYAQVPVDQLVHSSMEFLNKNYLNIIR